MRMQVPTDTCTLHTCQLAHCTLANPKRLVLFPNPIRPKVVPPATNPLEHGHVS